MGGTPTSGGSRTRAQANLASRLPQPEPLLPKSREMFRGVSRNDLVSAREVTNRLASGTFRPQDQLVVRRLQRRGGNTNQLMKKLESETTRRDSLRRLNTEIELRAQDKLKKK
jgi:hypothetical protein